MSSYVISIDCGLSGAIAVFKDNRLVSVHDMPIKKKLVKKGLRVYKHKDPKIVYKTGKKKGERPTIWKTKPKHKTVFDDIGFYCLLHNVFLDVESDSGVAIVIERQMALKGQTGWATAKNYGAVAAMCEVLTKTNMFWSLNDELLHVEIVSPASWKKGMGLIGKDKDASMELAHSIFHGKVIDLKIDRHDKAEACLMGRYFLKNRRKK